MHRLFLLAALGAGAVAVAAAANDEPAFRFHAPIEVTTSAAFVQLPLPAGAYARSVTAGLQDLRVVDAGGQRVPFALLAPRAAETRQLEQESDATLYPLPAKPGPDGVWPLPMQISIRGDRVDIRPPAASASAPPRGGASAGWLIDLGERQRDDPPVQSLKMLWSGPAEFSAAFRIEVSDDLRQWRSGGAGQLLSLASPAGELRQHRVMLPREAAPAGALGGPRFVRLLWLDAANAPAISGARTVSATPTKQTIDPPVELAFDAGPPPPDKHTSDEAAKAALHFDLGGVLPISQVELRWGSGTRVLPARLQARDRADQPWRELGPAVFYRLERGTEISHSPPVALQASARFLRIVPDARAAVPDAAPAKLLLQAPLASIVFAAQGQPPYRLLAGAEKAPPSALPIATLVPALDDERARFGRATLGEWSEVPAVARAVEQQRQRAALRPWLLWSVLLAGVAALAFMVWKLSRSARPNA